MQRYLAQRLLAVIPMVLGVSLLASALIRLVPGDAIMAQIAGAGHVRPEDLAQIRHDLGLDRPFVVQFADWLAGAVRGDFGTSLVSGRPVRDDLLGALPLTAELTLLALLVSTVAGVLIGVVSASRQDSLADYLGRSVALFGLAIPDFWLAIMIILAFAIWFQWQAPPGYAPLWQRPAVNLQQIGIPALILGFRLSAVTMRMVRSSTLEVLREDYIRTAWAKGLRERTVMARHVIKNAFIPVITTLGNQMRFAIGGTIVLETVFSLPGLGRLTYDAILQRDYPMIQASVSVIALVSILINLAVDMSYSWFDPRIRA